MTSGGPASDGLVRVNGVPVKPWAYVALITVTVTLLIILLEDPSFEQVIVTVVVGALAGVASLAAMGLGSAGGRRWLVPPKRRGARRFLFIGVAFYLVLLGASIGVFWAINGSVPVGVVAVVAVSAALLLLSYLVIAWVGDDSA